MKLFRKRSDETLWHGVHGLFKRYFEGTASTQERRIVESWKATRDRKSNFFFTKEMMEEDRIQTYRQLSQRFNLKPADASSGKKKNPVVALSPFSPYATAASIAIIIGTFTWLGITGQLNFKGMEEKFVAAAETISYPAEPGERAEVRLPDGSLIQLNKGSRLHLLKDEFNKQKRELWLDGEAFFDVAKDPDKPFIVHYGSMQAVVRGTSFNIKAYQQLGEYTVSVRSGKVEVYAEEQSLSLLTPDQQLVYQLENEHYEISELAWENAAAWRDGVLVFSNANLEELKLRLHQNFDVQLDCAGDVLQGVRLHAIFPKESSLEDVLKNISGLYDVNYAIDGKQVSLYQ